MMSQLFVGLMTEGKTDHRFLIPIVEKTLIKLSFRCKGSIDTDVFSVGYKKEGGFKEYVRDAAQRGVQQHGISVLVVHADADSDTNENTYRRKIEPALHLISEQDESDACKVIAALVPIRETESWLLADKVLFKKLIGSDLNDNELNISGHPESFTDPKQRIEQAIRAGRSHLPKKIREALKLHDLYSLLGESLDLDSLENFVSFKDFEKNMEVVFKELNLL